MKNTFRSVTSSKSVILITAALLVVLLAPKLLYPVFLMEALCYAAFAAAFNLLFGYAGLLSFGHAAYFGTAAYVTGFSVKVLGVPPEIGLLLGALSAGVLGAAIGALSIRQHGIYLAMITFAFGEMVYFIALQAPFTGGEDGLQTIPRGRLFGLIDLDNDMAMYALVFVLFAATVLAVHRIVNSPFGNVLVAIRENETRAISLGFKVRRYKLAVFVMSASLAGLAGGTKALIFHFSSLDNIYWHQSGEVVLMTLLGGVGTAAGPLVGAVFVISLYHFLARAGEWVPFLIGATFVVCVLMFRRGLIGEWMAWRDRRARRAADDAGDAAGQTPLLSNATSVGPQRRG